MAPGLLIPAEIAGRVVTGDALYDQHRLLAQIRQAGTTNLAAQLRHDAWQLAHVVLRLLGLSPAG